MPSIKLADLADVNDNAALSGDDGVVVWSEVDGEFVVSREITVDGIEFDASGPGTILEGFMDGALGLNKTLTAQAPSCEAVATYVDGLRVEDLADAKGLNRAANGEFIVWDDASKGWLPKELAMGLLSDVELTGTADKQILKYDLASALWENWTPDYLNATNGYTRTQVDAKLTALVTGLEHEISVLAIADTPPVAPTLDQVYIVGPTPTGVWVGQSNNLARWDGAAWAFDAPRDKEAHLVEAELATYSWNGTKWVKVATASTSGSAAAGDIWTVGSIQQSILTEAHWATALGTEASKWALADGRNVTGSKYATLTGNSTIPDLRGAYMRMAGVNNAKANWDGGTLATFQEDSTAGPKNPFRLGKDVYNTNISASWSGGDGVLSTYHGAVDPRYDTISRGGDSETRPKTYAVNYFIKIN
jgi:hypothetical protein